MNRERQERMLAIAVAAVCAVAVLALMGRLPHRVGFLQSAEALPGQSARPSQPYVLPASQIDLRVILWPRGPAGPSRSWRITCPGEACAHARAHTHDLLTEPVGNCGAGDDGMGEALITGRIGGRFVDDWLDHRDGCNVRRWHRLRTVLRAPIGPAQPR